MLLSDLPSGSSAKVLSILPDCEIRRRLQDLGLIENTTVTCLFRSPLGDPTAYWIRGAVIALRKKDASNVLLKEAQV